MSSLTAQRFSTGSAESTRRAYWETALVLVLAFGVLLIDARNPRLLHDEAYTILAARSWLVEGSFRIGGGEYVRVPGFTVLVAWSLAMFGDTLLAARLPSVIPASFLIALVFFWMRRNVGMTAAASVALLLCFSNFAIGIAHYSRFYALHGLLFWIGAVALYNLFAGGRRMLANYSLLLLAALALAAAAYLQMITVVGLAGLSVWAVLDPTLRTGVLATFWRRAWRLATGAALLLGVVTLYLMVDVRAFLGELYATYRWAPGWAAELKWEHGYYLEQFARDVPLLFYLFPLAALLALARAPRPALFCLTIPVVAVLLHSFAAFKGHRFIYYTYPFLFGVWAIAIDALAPFVRDIAFTAVRRIIALAAVAPSSKIAASGAKREGALRIAGAALAVITGLVALAGNPDFSSLRSVPIQLWALARGEDRTAARLASEASTIQALRDLIEKRAGLVLTSSDVVTLYYLGRHDALIRPSGLGEPLPGQEVDRDMRTGSPIIRTPETLRRVLTCHPSGIAIVWGYEWRAPHGIPAPLADIIEQRMQPVKLPGTMHVRAFTWQHEPPAGITCRTIYGGLRVPLEERLVPTISRFR